MAYFAKFISLARTPEELKQKQQQDAAPVPPPKIVEPVYPYGLCISLDEDTIKKLGLDTDDCEVGATIHLCCMAEVTDFSVRKTSDGTQRRIELQITDMAFENESEESAATFEDSERMQKRYGINKDAKGDGA